MVIVRTLWALQLELFIKQCWSLHFIYVYIHVYSSEKCVPYDNSPWPSDIIWHHRTGSTLVQLVACHRFGTNPLLEPMLNHWNKIQWNFNQNTNFHCKKCISKLQSLICSCLSVLKLTFADMKSLPVKVYWSNNLIIAIVLYAIHVVVCVRWTGLLLELVSRIVQHFIDAEPKICVNIGSGNGFCLMAPNLLLNQCWLIIREDLWHSS